MTPARRADPDLDSLIDDITIDCHDQDKQLQSFENAFDEHATLPCTATVIGEQVEILHIGQADNRRELIATCQRNGRRYQITLLDLDTNADPTTSRLLAAYRHWTGT